MLTLYHNGSSYPLQVDDYYIRELVSGLNEIIFELSIRDPVYMMIQEEEQITDRGGQRYLVKQIDAGATSAKIICQLDLDAWKQTMYVGYNSGSLTCRQTIEAVAPTGWTVVDRAYYSQLRTIKGAFFTFDEEHYRLVGKRTHKVFRLGDRVRIRVKNANLEQRLLDYELIENLK